MSSSPTALAAEATRLFHTTFGDSDDVQIVFVPGRLNLIGEHIDYHNLPVLPVALQRGVCVAFRPARDAHLQAVSAAAPGRPVSFSFAGPEAPETVGGDWGNYLKAAALIASTDFGVQRGLQAAVVSNLPVAAGLSSSSALLIAFTFALLAASAIRPNLLDLMRVLPEGEQFVGTRGGGMDHAAILAAQHGHALRIGFAPFTVAQVPVPQHWCFLVADSLQAAEKSAALVGEYNRRREAGTAALRTLGLTSFQHVPFASVSHLLERLDDPLQQRTFRHVTTESHRVARAIRALSENDLQAFAYALNESHTSLRDDLLVSMPKIDAMVTTARAAGAAGARITGAGFGGCLLAVCDESSLPDVRATLIREYYADLAPDDIERHLFLAEPASGALELLNV